MNKRQDSGYILATAMLMLLVLTVIGVAALRTSSLENIVAGNIRELETCRELSDSGRKPASGSIDTLVADFNPGAYAAYVPAGTVNSLATELRTSLLPPNTTDTSMDAGDANADLEFSVGAANILVDIDKTGVGGEGTGSISHNCYAGVGRCAGKKKYYYRINSECNDPAIGIRSITGSLYTYVEK